MRLRLWPGLFFAVGIMAQELAPIGIVRGALMQCDATHLTLGVDESHIFRFLTDARTFIERDHMRIFCPSLRKGERIELLLPRLGIRPRGTVFYADELQILVKWDDGRSESLRPQFADRFRILEDGS